jgi:ABC-2 type transport system ATP-binding protein
LRHIKRKQMSEITLEFQNLTKIYSQGTFGRRKAETTIAVDDLSVEVKSGRVTGFLGPNGAGKSTSLRCLLDLVSPSSGNTKVLGVNYKNLDNPTRTVGALLDSRGFHPGLTARQNLMIMVKAAGISQTRIDEVIELVQLTGAIDKRTKGFSLGMKQRLSLAIVLLGDPQILVLDEPANGLDPQGIVWLRNLLKQLASQGRTILVSSHQLPEMQNTVDEVIILNHGKLITAGSMSTVCNGRTLEEAFLQLTSEAA